MDYTYWDIGAAITGFSALGIFRPDEALMIIYLLVYPYLYFTKRTEQIKYLLLSSAIALMWVLFASGEYHYRMAVHPVLGLSAFPLFSWALGLFGMRLVYEHFSAGNYQTDIIRFSILFTILLLFVETIGYHYFNIQLNANYPGLPLCDCIHAPRWMQIGYFVLGPLYYTLSYKMRTALARVM